MYTETNSGEFLVILASWFLPVVRLEIYQKKRCGNAHFIIYAFHQNNKSSQQWKVNKIQ